MAESETVFRPCGGEMTLDDMIGKIICGDCLEVMKNIPDKSIDLILTDPPYGINYNSNRTDRSDYLQNDRLDDWLSILPAMFTEFKRILKDSGCCCCCCGGGGGKTPVTALFTVEAIKHFNLIQTLVWKKTIGLGWHYRPSYENIVVLSKSKDNYNFYDDSKKCSNVIEFIGQKIPQRDEHPTVKPVRLMEKLIRIHSQENDLILDPFSGSCTTAVACKLLNRRCISIEISPEYCAIGEKRLRNTLYNEELAL
jgi:site-specific DNA-methyltransferase (adenine-specific)